MKKLSLVFSLLIVLLSDVNSQPSIIVKRNEFVQILDKFICISELPNHFHGKAYAVRLVNEANPDIYSIAITAITYAGELPQDSIYCLKLKDKYFFIIQSRDISLDVVGYNNSSFHIKSNEIREIKNVLFSDTHGVLAYPWIMVLEIKKRNHLFNYIKVQFKTYHPIEKLSKKYWPIDKPDGIINEPFDLYGKTVISSKLYLENGNGKFKIKTR